VSNPADRYVRRYPCYVADGAIAAGGTPQLVLPMLPSRSYLELQNLSNGPLWFENGAARATATISGGKVSSVAVTNSGFNYTIAPLIIFYGGGNAGNSSYLGNNQPGGEGPNTMLTPGRPAIAHCVMSGSAGNLSVSSIVVDDPGAGYVCAPFVFIQNNNLDIYGVATPSATSGRLLTAQGPPLVISGTAWTDQIAVFGATTGQAFLCRWMP
jgi:hypothetical protein